MKYRDSVRHELDRKAKAIIIMGILLSFAVMLIPLWQKGSSRVLERRTIAAEERLDQLQGEERLLLSSISEVNGVSFTQEVAIALANN